MIIFNVSGTFWGEQTNYFYTAVPLESQSKVPRLGKSSCCYCFRRWISISTLTECKIPSFVAKISLEIENMKMWSIIPENVSCNLT